MTNSKFSVGKILPATPLHTRLDSEEVRYSRPDRSDSKVVDGCVNTLGEVSNSQQMWPVTGKESQAQRWGGRGKRWADGKMTGQQRTRAGPTRGRHRVLLGRQSTSSAFPGISPRQTSCSKASVLTRSPPGFPLLFFFFLFPWYHTMSVSLIRQRLKMPSNKAG